MEKIVALYDERENAYEAVNALIEANIERKHISLLSANADGEFQEELAEEAQEEYVAEGAARGAVGGGVLGGIIGTAIGLSSFAIPGIGPFIGAGALVSALSGIGIGVASGTLYGALVTWGASEMEADYYAEGIRRGGTLVAVEVPEGSAEYVSEILDNFDPVDIEERAATWRQTGWTPKNATTETIVHDSHEAREEARANERNASKFRFDDYKADFERHYHDFYAASGQPFISYEPAYQYGYDLARDIRFRDSEWDDVCETAEVEWERNEETKRSWDEVKEAVNYAWTKVTNALSDLVDRDEETYDGVPQNEFSPTYRSHYQANYFDAPHPYDYYVVHYQYGTYIAQSDHFDDDDWDLIENDVRREWEREYGDDGDSTWEDIKDAVRHGWESVKETVSDWTDDDEYDETYAEYDPYFNEHYNTRYADFPHPYHYYRPAYYYGAGLADNDAYLDREWDHIEPEVRADWERRHTPDERAWEEVRDAIRYGWTQIRTVA